MIRLGLALALLGGALLVTSGCAHRPLGVRGFAGDGGRDLIVVVPGLGASGRTVEREGVLAAIREAGFRGDLRTADVHFGHFLTRTVADRLIADALPEPGRYRRVWLLGISMGGMAALLAASKAPDRVDGVIALSPWLGRPGIGSAIARAGGIEAWRPPPRPGWDAALWAWWKTHPLDARPLVVTGYGDEDAVNGVPTPLVDRLPPERVVVERGGHTWEVWRRLSRRIVADVVCE